MQRDSLSSLHLLFLSLSCIESWCFSATFREILLPSSGKVCECVSDIMCLQRIDTASAKQSVITALFDRADNVVSNEKDKIEEKHLISAALQQNGYPKEFIQKQ